VVRQLRYDYSVSFTCYDLTCGGYNLRSIVNFFLITTALGWDGGNIGRRWVLRDRGNRPTQCIILIFTISDL